MTGDVTAFGAGQLFDGDRLVPDRAILVRDGRVADIVEAQTVPAGTDYVQLEGGILAPGFVDLQVNGGGRVMFNDAPSAATLRTIAAAHAGLGVTALLPTLITDRPDVTRAAIEAIATSDLPGIAGLHLEGPHLSIAKKGAHDGDLIRSMGEDDLQILLGAAARLPVLKVTVAPESVTPEQVKRLAAAGVVISLGHSACGFADAQRLAEAGATCVTHLFNAMSGLGHREPGLVGAALALGGLSAGLIADLTHVHGDVIRLALAAKTGPGAIFLVSDAMAPAGTTMDSFHLNGRLIRRAGGQLTLQDGTLAGADLDLATAQRNLVGLGVPLDRALAMATRIPADVIGATGLGRLRPGGRADFVHLTPGLDLAGVWRGGQKIA
ncbi:N-acetylglucosamine-6-phosphate deacetylase [Actibacterium sp. 188UL27-1]|uniref:N-acetylglucosamine-6-phosphate deacetylase n=1 Tax=Actibacterium sp. 188UL27-1 TaxID=2786961 RepID=UPI00195E67D0|nr:N-acetylglucosamine-6-phosphate deacetylase [Actibacterium sp. 188UL27-1]MBM7066619.1 N-acetylglucosamine-6-phosphate deacetylase [Actibacterium sp. 188UL27-1]